MLFLIVICGVAWAGPKVELSTSMGDIVIELNDEKAPKTVENFIKYVKAKHYDGLIFHRVIDGFMIQGGGHKPDMSEAQTSGSIRNEANNGLSNEKGTIAMARTSDPHSATAQFFINVADNSRLDYQSKNDWGYCVFGKVIKGMDTVNKIKSVETGSHGPYQNVPKEPIVIKSAKML
ncbi:MAG: hypothetical protein CME62_00565 [Halobacteriovoraceae bacterium]|nr:hypothetical protein [Halobacteriovoraceae bacterium]